MGDVIALDRATKPKPQEQAPKAERSPKVIGVRVTKDAIFSTRCGFVCLTAYKPITDPLIIALVKSAGIKTEPVFAE